MRFFHTLTSATLSLTLGCTTTPRGTPASTRAAHAAADAIAIATSTIAVAGGYGPLTSIPSDESVARSTRIELTVTGLMSCASLAPRDVSYEILDGASRPMASGSFSQKWDAVTAAFILKEQNYSLLLRSQRNGKILRDKSLDFSDETPWKIYVPLKCPEAG